MSGFWSVELISDNESLWVDAAANEWSPLIPTRKTKDGKRQKLNAVTAALIYLLPFINIEEITEENASEVFIRCRMLEIAMGGGLVEDMDTNLLNKRQMITILKENLPEVDFRAVADKLCLGQDSDGSTMITLANVRRHIGLRVGSEIVVSPFEDQIIGHLRTQATKALKDEQESNLPDVN